MRRYIVIAVFLSIALLPSSAGRRKETADDGYALKVRGVMESFPSVADGFETRLDSYVEADLNHYFYCPSDDRYCNRWGWKFLYNDSDRKAIAGLKSMCSRKGVEFVWTANLSDSYDWTREDYDFLLNKLVIMYYNGIRSFGLCFPDDPRVSAVRDVLLQDMTARMKEKVSLHIINDIPAVMYPSESDVAKTLMRGYHFDSEFMSKAISCGSVICRLTVNDAFTGIPIAAATDFARSPQLYQPDRSIAEGLAEMRSDVKEAFMTFLRHTGGIDESSDTRTFDLDTWTREMSDTLFTEFDRIERVPEILQSVAGTAVVDALRPWLAEFGRLGTRGKRVLECMEYYKSDDIGRFWLAYIAGRVTEEELLSYRCFPVGEGKLHPFCEQAMNQMIEGFAQRLSEGSSPQNLAATLFQGPDAALDSDYHTSVPSSGHIEFPIPAYANTCRLLTGPLPEDGTVLFRQIGTDGGLIAEFVVKSPYTEFDLKEGAVKVDVLGEVDIYESIFVYL